MKHANSEITKKDIDRGFTEGRSESMIQEEKDRDKWELPIINEEETFKGGFLGRE